MYTKQASWFGLGLLVSLLVWAPAIAQQAADEEEFTPRSSAPPAKRTGGASRGGSSAASAASVSFLAPANTVGYTTREQPVIYWHLTADTTRPIELAINDPKNLEKPVLETTLAGPHRAGLHKLDLSKLKQDGKPVRLTAGVKYDLVAEVGAAEAGGASENPTATCRILRLDPKDIPAAAAREKDKAKLAAVYAKEAIWFDYLDALNSAIEANPTDESLLQKRAKALAAQRLVMNPDGSITEQPAKRKSPGKS
jgi:hypothetical protein